MVESNKRVYTGTENPIGIQRMRGSAKKTYDNTMASLQDTIESYESSIDEGLQFTPQDIERFMVGENNSSKPTTTKNTNENWEKITVNSLISFEGFKKEAYFDKSLSGRKDGFRVGYGSGTRTVDGKVTNVTAGDTVTKAEALADLNRRIKIEFGPRAAKQSGEAWDNFSNNSKAALTSIVYNAGRLPKNIQEAIKTGDNSKIAAAIVASGDGTDIAGRRTKESLLFLTPDSANSLVTRRNK